MNKHNNRNGVYYSKVRQRCECGRMAVVVVGTARICMKCKTLGEVGHNWHRETTGYRGAEDFYRVAMG